MQIRSIFLFIILFTFSLVLNAQKSTLKLEEIMRGEAFTGYSPENIQWSEDGSKVFFTWNPTNAKLRDYYYVETDFTKSEFPYTGKADSANLQELPIVNGVYNSNRSLKLYSKNGDLYLQNLKDFSVLRITNTLDFEYDAAFLKNEDKIVFRLGLNLFSWNIKTGQTEQLTDIRKGTDKKEQPLSEQDKWIEKENLELIGILKERKELADLRKARNESLKEKRPKTIWIGESDIFSLELSPDERFVYYTLVNRAKTKSTIVPDYVAQNGYTAPNQAREKVGSDQDSYSPKIYDRSRDTVYSISSEALPGIYDKPAFLKLYSKDSIYNDKYKEPRSLIWHGPFLHSNANTAVYDLKSLDGKDRWIIALEPETANCKILDRQHDDAWIGGPGIEGWKGVAGDGGFSKDGQFYWFHSEESGFSHLYTVNLNSLEKKALTSGKYEVTKAFLSQDGKSFYLTSSEVDPGERHFYKLDIESQKKEKITSMAGNNEVYISPDEKKIAIRHSYSNKPWELYLQENEPSNIAVKITASQSQVFRTYKWREPELVYFTAEDGTKVRARLYRPEKPQKAGPAVIFVHGAGYLQNVHKWWSTYHREYMFHNLLADMGYTVLDIDYRASSGYGRDFRTGIYRHMGGKDLSDQVDGAKFLVSKYAVSPKRIGIYGGSYGGFITLMAMFNKPEIFKVGAALRSVTDWAHYNHPYSSNILNTPIEDPDAYRRSSPIYFAEGLKGKLLMLHGIVDDNVQFQDVVRLSQRLIELGKENWELAVFPMEAHGFIESSSWTDEYRRILELFEETIGNKSK